MTPKVLAQALKGVIDGGLEVDKAVQNFVETLKRRGMLRILPKVAYEMELLEKRETSYRPTMSVAKDTDFTQALTDSGTSEAEVIKKVDETLIGGYKLEKNGKLTDTSYKKALLDLYRNITN